MFIGYKLFFIKKFPFSCVTARFVSGGQPVVRTERNCRTDISDFIDGTHSKTQIFQHYKKINLKKEMDITCCQFIISKNVKI